jgi:hypothetical protein
MTSPFDPSAFLSRRDVLGAAAGIAMRGGQFGLRGGSA